MKKLVVDKKFNNKKIQNFLQYNFSGLLNSSFYKLLRKKDIKVNGKRINENIIIYENDIIEIYLEDKFLYRDIDLDIIYEDDNILIVNKPIGIEVLSDNNYNLTYFVHNKFLNLENNFPYPCHRLDLNTSGLVVYAKNKLALDIINNKIKNHEIRKFYKCIVIQIPNEKKCTKIDYLFKDNKKSMVYISHTPKTGYKKIITSYKVLEENKIDNLATLEVELHTGRTHQIRAHLAFLGFPILGDGKYGINKINKKFNKTTQELISYKLMFDFKTDANILNYLNNKIFYI